MFSSVDISQRYRTEYDEFGNYIRDYADGYDLYQRLTVTSADIDKVEQISRDISHSSSSPACSSCPTRRSTTAPPWTR